MMKWLRLIVLALIVVAIASFALENGTFVEVSFWPLGGTMIAPLFIVTLVAFAMGAIIGAGGLWLWAWPTRKRAARDRRRLAEFEAQELQRRGDDVSSERRRLVGPSASFPGREPSLQPLRI